MHVIFLHLSKDMIYDPIVSFSDIFCMPVDKFFFSGAARKCRAEVGNEIEVQVP